jgi:hypothetical protein
MKKAKPIAPKTAHTSNTKKGMGDYYGSGMKNPMGRMREGLGMTPVPPSKLKKPPKALA